MVTDGLEWCREAMDEAYIPIPFPEEKLEPLEWLHCLGTLDVCTVNHGIKFCDEDGYDIVPIRMINVAPKMQEERMPNDLIHPRKGGDPLHMRNKEIQSFKTPSVKSKFPPIERLCEGCGIEHLLKDCLHKNAQAPPIDPTPKLEDPPHKAIELRLPTYTH